jgi:membrane-bound serine protease (ClpP class)
LITLTTGKALTLGIADESAETLEDVLLILGLQDAEVIAFQPSWSEKLVRFLTEPVVSSLLMTLGFMGLVFELRSPGFGVGGIIGLIALSLFFGASFIAQLATITEVLVFLAGVILLLLEVTIIPGFGVAGIAGIGLMLWGMYEMLIGEYPTPEQLEQAFLGLNIGIIGGIIAIIILLRTFVTSKLFRKHIPILSQDSNISVGLDELIGVTGIALTACVPSGKADFNGRQVNITTRGEFLEQGIRVIVLSVEGNTALVHSVDSQTEE